MTLRQNKLVCAIPSGLVLLLGLWCAAALSQSAFQQAPQQAPGQIPEQSRAQIPAQTSQQLPGVEPASTEAWLVTFGPGEAYWERFGHNAIWLREPAAGLDHTFNFGFFDFEQEDFLLRFLRGKMMYFSIAQPAVREFELYQQQNRSIRVQKLALQHAEYVRLRDYLLTEIKPENRNYPYDYYLNNCSTRIRDALDLALGGELSDATKNSPSAMNFRDQTRRLTQSQYWYYLGLEIGLGYPVDRPISRWEDMFIPMVVADEVSRLSRSTGAATASLDLQLYASSLPEAPAFPTAVWLRYLLSGLLLAGLYWLGVRYLSAKWANVCGKIWVLLLGCGGLGLSALWLATDHSVTANNANLLLFNPLLVLAALPYCKRGCAVLLLAGVSISAILLLLPQHQYNLDVWMLLAPMNLSVAIHWLGNRQALKRAG